MAVNYEKWEDKSDDLNSFNFLDTLPLARLKTNKSIRYGEEALDKYL